MLKFKNVFATVLCVVMLLSGVSVNAAGGQILNAIDTTNGEVVSEFYSNLLDYIIKNYRYDITREELMEAAVMKVLTDHPELWEDFGKGAFEALDENSMFYNAEEYESRFEDVSGVYVGIGINVYFDEEYVILGEAIEGSPAENSGLQVGDIVTAVDGEDVTGYGLDKVTSLIKGEPGTSVSVTVKRKGEIYTYTLKRATIKINPVTYEVIESCNVGYLKLSSFNSNTADSIETAMNYFGERNVKTVILDLRNNLGGYLDAAITVASYFIPDGKLVATEEYKNEKKNKKHYAEKTKYKFNGVVLINEYSASASELVSGAIKDYGTGVIVGQTSYGKGTVQNTIPLRSNQYMWYTVAEYYTPSHNTIHKEGIEPHYTVSNKYADFDMSTVKTYEVTRVLKVGDTGEDVYAVKERLNALGYRLEVNDVYDELTANAVENFQSNVELFPYGVADITTQIRLNDELKTSKVLVDKQYERALSLAKNIK